MLKTRFCASMLAAALLSALAIAPANAAFHFKAYVKGLPAAVPGGSAGESGGGNSGGGTPAPTNCVAPWSEAVADGQSVLAYAAPSVAAGETCQSQTRTCSNGTLSGTYTESVCHENCVAPWGSAVPHGYQVTAFSASSVEYGSTCQSETRVCTEGVLSGTYTASACAVEDPVPHPLISALSGSSAAVTASSSYATTPVWKAFDGQVGTYDAYNARWQSAEGVSAATITYNFGSTKTVSSYTLATNLPNGGPKTWTFQGSNDGVTWVTLDSQTAASWTTSTVYTFNLAAPGTYSQFRLNMTSSFNIYGCPLIVAEMQIVGY